MMINIRYIVIAVLMFSTWGFMRTHVDKQTPLAIPLSDFPVSSGEWRMVRDSQFDQATLDVLRPTEYMAKRYARRDGAVVDLYVGYHDGASKAGPLHSPKNCLPGSGWFEVSSRLIKIQLSEGELEAVEAVYQQGTTKELFLYWFQVGGRSITNEYSMKFEEIRNSIVNGRRDAAFIRISVPVIDDAASAYERAESFLRAVYPSLKAFLPS